MSVVRVKMSVLIVGYISKDGLGLINRCSVS